MALKDAKVDSEAGERISPIKTTVFGKKLQPIATSSSSHITPMKLMPKLVSPQMKGGLIKVAPSPRAPTPSGGSLPGPRPLISASLRPGRVRNSITSGPRPAIVSPRMPTVLGANNCNFNDLDFVGFFFMISRQILSICRIDRWSPWWC